VSEPLPYVVVGAGPTGAAAAKALAGCGRRVVVLDVGLTLEPEREAARARMSATEAAGWSAADVALTCFRAQRGQGAGYKQLFGSDVAFRDDGVLELRADPAVAARPSHALGGLSNVWGAGVLPYTDGDMAGWPIGASELAEGYRAVLRFMPHAGEEDELSERYPLLSPPAGPLLRTEAAERLLARLRAHARELDRAGFCFGASRLAVRVDHPAPERGCCYCLHCLDGCPYGHIYNAAQTIEELRAAGLIDYRPGLHVERLREAEGEVVVEGRELDPRAPGRAPAHAGRQAQGAGAGGDGAGGDGAGRTVAVRAARVFLAAGSLASTIVLQRSGLLPERVELLDSQTVYLPFLWTGRVGQSGREPGHTLAQLFLVHEGAGEDEQPVHISLYTYNPGLTERARATHPALASLAGPALDRLTRRLVIGICFIHSDASRRIACAASADQRRATLEPVPNPALDRAIGRLSAALRRSLAPLGLIPLGALSERAGAGGGFHYGGAAPMRERPRQGESDALGRPAGARLVHLVDAACFPSIPSGTITLPAMANAHRIVTAALQEDREA
jgi:choline dehydrogenase-like flavoprotein